MGLERQINDSKEQASSSKRASKMTWEQFQQTLSNTLDEDIISYAKSSGKIYVGGKCRFSSEAEQSEFHKTTTLIIEAKLYFKEQFSTKAEIRTITRRCSYDEFSHDSKTISELREIIDSPYEVDVAKPIVDE